MNETPPWEDNEDIERAEMNDCLLWEDVEEAAKFLFNVWTLGSELDWAKEAWGHIVKCGLSDCSSEVSKTETLMCLVTLAKYYHEFCGAGWDEDPGWDLPTYIEPFDDFNLLSLGILAGKQASSELLQSEDDYELLEQSIMLVVDGLRHKVASCLVNAYGSEFELYSRLRKTISVEHEIEDDEDDEDEWEVTSENLAAYNFITKGF